MTEAAGHRTGTAACVRRSSLRAILLATAVIASAMLGDTGLPHAQTASNSFAPRNESPEDFPAGTGRDETFYACTACHGFKLVAQQGMNRRQWSDSINWMSEKHNMPPLDEKDRDIVLNYLEAAFPPGAPARGGWQNPFTGR